MWVYRSRSRLILFETGLNFDISKGGGEQLKIYYFFFKDQFLETGKSEKIMMIPLYGIKVPKYPIMISDQIKLIVVTIVFF